MKAYTTKERIDGKTYSDQLIISDNLSKALIVQKLTTKAKLDGWFQVSVQTFTGQPVSRYPIMDNMN